MTSETVIFEELEFLDAATIRMVGNSETGNPKRKSFVRVTEVPAGIVCEPSGVRKINLVPDLRLRILQHPLIQITIFYSKTIKNVKSLKSAYA